MDIHTALEDLKRAAGFALGVLEGIQSTKSLEGGEKTVEKAIQKLEDALREAYSVPKPFETLESAWTEEKIHSVEIRHGKGGEISGFTVKSYGETTGAAAADALATREGVSDLLYPDPKRPGLCLADLRDGIAKELGKKAAKREEKTKG